MKAAKRYLLDTASLGVGFSAHSGVVMDMATRKVIGIHSDLTADIAMAAALLNAIRWHGRPVEVLIDNCPDIHRVESLCQQLGITLSRIAPGHTVVGAGAVERAIRRMAAEWGVPEVTITDDSGIGGFQ